MANKSVSNGQERFDGFAISVYDGKFSGGFDLDENLALDIGFDDVVTFVVTGRVGGVSFGETKTGDVKRTNTFQVTSSVALDPQTAAKVLNTLGAPVDGVNAGQLTIDDDTPIANTDKYDDWNDIGGSDYTSVNDHTPVAATNGSAPLGGGMPVKDAVLARFLEAGD